ncbi:MAG: hypothetical protein HQM08_05475 [Candidatus Riflebacteria bacterium]|nr:hypothetical protein [Candidatus Riflebacteria bacterium]
MALFIRESPEISANSSGKSAFSNSAPLLQNRDRFIYGSGIMKLGVETSNANCDGAWNFRNFNY